MLSKEGFLLHIIQANNVYYTNVRIYAVTLYSRRGCRWGRCRRAPHSASKPTNQGCRSGLSPYSCSVDPVDPLDKKIGTNWATLRIDYHFIGPVYLLDPQLDQNGRISMQIFRGSTVSIGATIIGTKRETKRIRKNFIDPVYPEDPRNKNTNQAKGSVGRHHQDSRIKKLQRPWREGDAGWSASDQDPDLTHERERIRIW